MFTYKDGSSNAVATADLKTLIKVSNEIVNRAQVSTVFAKKIAHAKGIIDILDYPVYPRRVELLLLMP
jgi:hypothetical protein